GSPGHFFPLPFPFPHPLTPGTGDGSSGSRHRRISLNMVPAVNPKCTIHTAHGQTAHSIRFRGSTWEAREPQGQHRSAEELHPLGALRCQQPASFQEGPQDTWVTATGLAGLGRLASGLVWAEGWNFGVVHAGIALPLGQLGSRLKAPDFRAVICQRKHQKERRVLTHRNIFEMMEMVMVREEAVLKGSVGRTQTRAANWSQVSKMIERARTRLGSARSPGSCWSCRSHHCSRCRNGTHIDQHLPVSQPLQAGALKYGSNGHRALLPRHSSDHSFEMAVPQSHGYGCRR
ncbi:hypothetical protein Vafri_17653, partial [Volvox africanus]